MRVFNKRQFLVSAGAVAIMAPVASFAQDDIMKKLINKPDAGAWNVYGPGQTNKKVKDKDVTGGGSTKVAITSPTAAGREWEISASSPIDGEFKVGDKLLVAVWMKAADVEGGGTGKARLQVQISAAPYTSLGNKMLSITDTWQLYSFEIVATEDHAKGTTNVSLHLGFAKQTLFLGPALVLNFGSGA